MDVALHLSCICTGLYRTRKNILEVKGTTLSSERKSRKIKLLQMLQLKRGLEFLIRTLEVLIPVMTVLSYITGLLSIILLGGECEIFYYLVLSKIFAIIGVALTALILLLRKQLKDSKKDYILQYHQVLDWFEENAPELV